VEQADICGYLKNRKRGMFCKQGSFVNSHGSGDLANDSLGTFHLPCGGQGPNTFLYLYSLRPYSLQFFIILLLNSSLNPCLKPLSHIKERKKIKLINT
jgi:hypothetical protein